MLRLLGLCSSLACDVRPDSQSSSSLTTLQSKDWSQGCLRMHHSLASCTDPIAPVLQLCPPCLQSVLLAQRCACRWPADSLAPQPQLSDKAAGKYPMDCGWGCLSIHHSLASCTGPAA